MSSSSYDYLGSISGAFGYFTENGESGGKEKRERNGSWDHVLIYSLGAMEVSENQGSLLMIHQNQACSMLGSMLRSIMSENPHVFAQKINLMLGRVGAPLCKQNLPNWNGLGNHPRFDIIGQAAEILAENVP